jgi:hypothetical protein
VEGSIEVYATHRLSDGEDLSKTRVRFSFIGRWGSPTTCGIALCILA